MCEFLGIAGTLENNYLYKNERANATVETKADPVLRANRIYEGTRDGIRVRNEGGGLFEQNDIYSNNQVCALHLFLLCKHSP